MCICLAVAFRVAEIAFEFIVGLSVGINATDPTAFILCSSQLSIYCQAIFPLRAFDFLQNGDIQKDSNDAVSSYSHCPIIMYSITSIFSYSLIPIAKKLCI